jgi:putative ABC transport system permease protein
MRDIPALWIERLVPEDMRERVFREALRETDRACRLRRRRARTRFSRLGVSVWRSAQIISLVLECRRLARAAHDRQPASPRSGAFSMQFQDFRFGVRTLVKSPGFSLVAILTLALGICGTAATFSVVDHVLLRPLPYPGADRVVDVSESAQGRRTTVSPPNFIDWHNENVTFEALAGYQEDNLTLSAGDQPERVDAAAVGPEVFDVLAMRPLFGRVFTKDEGRPGAAKVVAISHALWQRRFGSNPKLVGHTITLEGEAYTVVGIMPERFDFPDGIQLWVPLVLGPDDLSNNQRGAHYIRVVGRLKAGITPEQGQADLDRIERRLAEQYPDKVGEYTVRVEPLLDMFVGDVRRPLLVLLGAVMFVLLIACANVSNLLLARATTRTGEIAVRSALGAGRRRIVAQLLAESLVLAAAGGLAGLMLTVWAVQALSTLAPQDLPRGVAFSLNPAVLTFAVAVSLLTGIVFGLVPAVVASRTDVASLLKDLRRGTGSAGRGRAIRNVLVSAEVALSLILLAGAGLAMRSFDRLMHVDPGFDPSHVLTFTIRLPEARYSTFASAEAFFRELNGRLHRPGIVSSGAIFQPPLSPGGFGGSFTIVGRPAGHDEGNAQVRPVTAGCLETLRIPLLAGRRVDSSDRGGGPGVAVISQTAARRYWPDQNPIGRQLRIHVSMGVKEQIREIVGVVGDVRTRALDQPFVPIIYVPASQYVADAMTFVVRTAGDPLTAVPVVTTELAALDRQVAMSRVRTMEDVVADSVAAPRFRTRILALFGVVALLLAAVGLYGVVAFSVTQRSAELGLRMALGAHRQDVLKLVLRQGLVPVGLGIGCGLVGAAALTSVMRALLYEVSALDPLTFAGVSSALLIVATLACYVPARRAMALDPVSTLR